MIKDAEIEARSNWYKNNEEIFPFYVWMFIGEKIIKLEKGSLWETGEPKAIGSWAQWKHEKLIDTMDLLTHFGPVCWALHWNFQVTIDPNVSAKKHACVLTKFKVLTIIQR